VDLTAVALGLVITKPVLKKRSVQRRRAKVVESVTLTGVNHGELTGQSENSALAGSIGKLGCSSTDESDDGGGVDDGSLGLLVTAQRENGMLAAEPDALDVDVLGEVPDVLGGVDSVVILSVHDTGVVEKDVDTTPGVERLDHGLDL